jgi:hypothetical protein
VGVGAILILRLCDLHALLASVVPFLMPTIDACCMQIMRRGRRSVSVLAYMYGTSEGHASVAYAHACLPVVFGPDLFMLSFVCYVKLSRPQGTT